MVIFISIMTALTVFLIIMLVATLFSVDKVKLKDDKFTINDLCTKIFRTSPEAIGNKLGIATDKYRFNCRILNIEPHVERIVLAECISLLILVFGLIIGFVLNNYYIMIATVALTIIVFIAPTSTIQSRAKDKQEVLEKELPRFLDLLETALKINMPIASAIETTANSIDGVLSDELKKALVQVQAGASTWQDALFDIAQRYEVDDFSDFVLDIVTAYEKGTDVCDSVERKSRELKQTTLLKAKEDASKLTNTILIPVMIFKMIPLMAILFLPVIMELMGGL